jgi:hypothetical protein
MSEEQPSVAKSMGLISAGSIRSKSSNRSKRFERLKRLERFELTLSHAGLLLAQGPVGSTEAGLTRASAKDC